MVHIRDVWINWFEGEENGYNVCEFHEWRAEDRIEVLDQAVVIKVSTELFDHIENQMAELPEKLLKDVYQKSYLRKNMSRVQLDYCFIATDGTRVIAIDTIGYKTPIRKSRLTPRQEQLVFEAIENVEEMEQYELHIPSESKEYHILSPHPNEMLGLTRKERQLKQLLFMALDQLHSTKNVAEMRYWCTEWAPSRYEEIQLMDFDEAWDSLLKEVKSGWSNRHYLFCESLVKGQAFFEKLWELEHGESVK